MSTASRFETAANLVADARTYSRQIWLAGLGAYVRAGQESAEYLKDLVTTGERLEKKGKNFITDTTDSVGEKLSPVVDRYASAKEKFEEGFEKVEAAFDVRVARGLNRLGIASRQDINALASKLDALTALVNAAEKNK